MELESSSSLPLLEYITNNNNDSAGLRDDDDLLIAEKSDQWVNDTWELA